MRKSGKKKALASAVCDYDTLYQPRLLFPPASASAASGGSSGVGEESLGANDLALKYLDDGMLSSLARSSGNRVSVVRVL